MKKIAMMLVVIFLFLTTTNIMPSVVYADDDSPPEKIELGNYDSSKVNVFQEATIELCLIVCDFATNMLTEIVGEEVSFQKIVFNKISTFDPNFFNEELVLTSNITEMVREQVNRWYSLFSVLAIAAYLIVLLVMGIKVVIGSTAGGLEKVKELAVKWVVGIMLLLLFPGLILKNAFKLNEVIVGMIEEAYGVVDHPLGTTVGIPEGEWSSEEIEFRSPLYVSKYTGQVSYGGAQANAAYEKALDDYRSSADLARIMRAYAGVYKQFIYIFIWIILYTQVIVMTVKYYKRYFVIAILFVVFPLVMLKYIIEAFTGKGGAVFSKWAKEMFVNIFIQSIHAIIYALIASIAISRVQEDIMAGDTMNWILVIIAVNFLGEGERIVRKILGVDSSIDKGIQGTGKAIAGHTGKAIGAVKRTGGDIGGALKGKK